MFSEIARPAIGTQDPDEANREERSEEREHPGPLGGEPPAERFMSLGTGDSNCNRRLSVG